MNKSTQQTAREFFLEHAGWSQKPGESQLQGRRRGARQLATAEAKARNAGLSFEWFIDQHCNSSDFNDTKPYYDLWVCSCRDASGACLTSLCGIDFGRNGQPWSDPYRRVVEAELASEAFHTQPATPATEGSI